MQKNQPTFIQEKLFTYICQQCFIVLGGGGGKGDYAEIVPLKITIVVRNDSLVIFWTVFTSVPTTFDLHCRYTAKLIKHSKSTRQ